VDCSYLLVERFTTVTNKGSSYTLNAEPKTGGERHSDKHTICPATESIMQRYPTDVAYTRAKTGEDSATE